MSIVREIIKELWNTQFNYKGLRVNFFGVPRFMIHDKESLRSTLDRLRRNGYIARDERGYCLTSKGRKFYKNRLEFRNFTHEFPKDSPKNLLVMFDVPQERNSHRDWLRKQLKMFNYMMIQKSVWIGPSPLPKEFVAYIKEIGMKDNIRTFKLAKAYVGRK